MLIKTMILRTEGKLMAASFRWTVAFKMSESPFFHRTGDSSAGRGLQQRRKRYALHNGTLFVIS
jgi:hypothetical protein